jgi:F-type H+-transporting ATPase subunit a
MHISLAAEKIFSIGGLPVTNTLLASWLSVIVLLVLAFTLKRKGIQRVPKGIQNVFEYIIEVWLNLMDGVTHDRKKSIRFFPIVATIFLFVVTSNWLGLLPGFGTIGLNEIEHGEKIFVPLFRTVNSDLNVTLALALISVIMVQVFGILAIGVVKYSKRFINWKNPIIGLLETIDQLATIISFSFRLFGNVFAGEVLLVIISSLIPFVIPLPFYFLEMFVGIIQGFIFAVLTLVFFEVATMETH